MVTRFSFPPYTLYWERFGGISSASFLDISSPPNIHSSPPPEIATRDAPGNIQPFVPRASYACDESGVSRITCELTGTQIIWNHYVQAKAFAIKAAESVRRFMNKVAASDVRTKIEKGLSELDRSISTP